MPQRAPWRGFLVSYLSVLAITNLVWEIAQLPLYAIWITEPLGAIVRFWSRANWRSRR
jgi:hypothetical protein